MACLNMDPRQRASVNAEIAQMQGAIGPAAADLPERRGSLKHYLRVLARPCRTKEIRAAASTSDLLAPGSDAELGQYMAAGFNTVVVQDLIEVTTDTWVRRTDEEIAYLVTKARLSNLAIILSLFADTQGDIERLTPLELTDRIRRWSAVDDGDIVGVYLINDDMFLTRTPVSVQVAWRSAIRAVTTSIPVFGMIGEFAVNATDQDVTDLYSIDAFDHLLFLMYPYNLGYVWSTPDALGVMHNHDITTSVADPDDQLRGYIETYIQALNDRFFVHLERRQLVIPVVQGFNYVGEPSQKLIRPADLQIQIEYASNILRTSVPTQADNTSVTVFWWGSTAGLTGIGDDPVLTESARRANFTQRQLADCGDHLPCVMSHQVFATE